MSSMFMKGESPDDMCEKRKSCLPSVSVGLPYDEDLVPQAYSGDAARSERELPCAGFTLSLAEVFRTQVAVS